MLKVRNLSKSYGAREILSGVSFSLERGQKAALVGPNGVGKTTLLKIIAGIEGPDGGTVETAKNTCIGYLPQDTSAARAQTIGDYLRATAGFGALEKEMEGLQPHLDDPGKQQRYAELQQIYERLGGYTFSHKVEVMLAGFGLEGFGNDRPLTDLSSGQKSKVALIGILLKGVDLLLLDEPTNNLDLPALIWLEDFLMKSEAACIIVSHDRRFLDRVASKVMELSWHTHTLTVASGTYSEYLARMEKERERQKETYRLQQEEIQRLAEGARRKKDAAERGSQWRGTDSDKFLRGFKRDRASKSARAAKAIERRIEKMEKVARPVERKPLEIPLVAAHTPGVLDIQLLDVIAGYPSGFQIHPISLSIPFGTRLGIMGLNGSGKTTILKTIIGQLPPLQGKVVIGSGIVLGDMLQEHETLPRDETPFAFLSSQTNLDEWQLYSTLVRFGLDARGIKKEIKTLSPGGRARLLLALFSLRSVNVLVLDEPTNHLDIEALEALEEMLQTYQGTVLLVSHDRHFLEKSTLHVTYLLTDGTFTKIPDYQEYVRIAEERARRLLRLL